MTAHRIRARVLAIAAAGMLALGACGGSRATESQPDPTAAIPAPTTTVSVETLLDSGNPETRTDPTDAERSPDVGEGAVATVTTTQAQTTTTTATTATPSVDEATADTASQPLPDIDEETNEFSDLDALFDELDALLADLAAGWTDNEGDVNP